MHQVNFAVICESLQLGILCDLQLGKLTSLNKLAGCIIPGYISDKIFFIGKNPELMLSFSTNFCQIV